MSAVIADTSVWLDFLGSGDERMGELLRRGNILMHPVVIGEIALGDLRNRNRILSELGDMKGPVLATDAEVLVLIEARVLFGTGIGFADAHLIASTLTTQQCTLFTRDKRLAAVAGRLGIAYASHH
jgi:hypothetical protein